MIKTKHITIGLIGLFITLFAFSCGNRRQENNNEKLKKKNDKELEFALFEQDSTPFHFFSARIGVDLQSTVQSAEFSCYTKINIDTAIGASVKVGPLYFANFMLTQDSVTFVNKRADCYFQENLNYLSSIFGASVEYDFFQDLLLGLPIGLEPDTKYQQIKADDHYILSSHKKRDFVKLEQEKLDVEEDLMLIKYHMDRTTLDVFKIEVEVPVDSASITINYIEKKKEDGYTVPELTTISIVNPKDTVFMELNYGVVTLNSPKVIKVNIPDSYTECETK